MRWALVPILVGVVATPGLPTPLITTAFTDWPSRAFVLPGTTLVYAAEQVSQTTVLRCGLVLNRVCIAVITC